ncbi:GNAT family N-acetyltransferase [Bremerella sp. JC770]|uniref:GNAT family N-acetyltransferase n=1 Tax=Bremerella sp. JC770 TaxID=3232137 RepID=UPI0034592BC8
MASPDRPFHYEIAPVDPSEYEEIVTVWEASVRATHDFLPEAMIDYFRPLILNEYLAAVTLASIRTRDGQIVGFLGTAGHRIEMLFVHPEFHRRGIGRSLLQHAIDVQEVTEVDVNEQNPGAISFYQRMGFEQYARSETDGQGNPFPLLHMRRPASAPQS